MFIGVKPRIMPRNTALVVNHHVMTVFGINVNPINATHKAHARIIDGLTRLNGEFEPLRRKTGQHTRLNVKVVNQRLLQAIRLSAFRRRKRKITHAFNLRLSRKFRIKYAAQAKLSLLKISESNALRGNFLLQATVERFPNSMHEYALLQRPEQFIGSFGAQASCRIPTIRAIHILFYCGRRKHNGVWIVRRSEQGKERLRRFTDDAWRKTRYHNRIGFFPTCLIICRISVTRTALIAHSDIIMQVLRYPKTVTLFVSLSQAFAELIEHKRRVHVFVTASIQNALTRKVLCRASLYALKSETRILQSMTGHLNTKLVFKRN